jgi:hypothetical protein
LIDATRLQDGKFVVLKLIQKSVHPYEAEIGNFLSSESLAFDPRNHCVPILEILHIPDDEEQLFLVMPLLREHDDPRFDTIGEVVEFFQQILVVSMSILYTIGVKSKTWGRACSLCMNTMLLIGMTLAQCSKWFTA